ncbi:hypothetical protein T10_6264 [Trichinella papuae]|uniref:Uncharacterized protein n=1 Tax=Trichinella papuae TaxID=268474 RepID=A0A0V1MSU6_9BILA|nr:hypothetical protein T10_6264 [Trichinella papuae]
MQSVSVAQQMLEAISQPEIYFHRLQPSNCRSVHLVKGEEEYWLIVVCIKGDLHIFHSKRSKSFVHESHHIRELYQWSSDMLVVNSTLIHENSDEFNLYVLIRICYKSHLTLFKIYTRPTLSIQFAGEEKLNYVPVMICRFPVWEKMILISKSDRTVELFRPVETSGGETLLSKVDTSTSYPEFNEAKPHCVITVDGILVGKERITAFGCANGSVCISYVNTESLNIETKVKKFDMPISVIKLLTLTNNSPYLLISPSLGPVMLGKTISDITEHSKSTMTLKQSDNHDVVVCVYHLKLNNENSSVGSDLIFVGTFSRYLLVYSGNIESSCIELINVKQYTSSINHINVINNHFLVVTILSVHVYRIEQLAVL